MTRNPRVATAAVVHSIARGRRHAANVSVLLIRENARDAIDINILPICRCWLNRSPFVPDSVFFPVKGGR